MPQHDNEKAVRPMLRVRDALRRMRIKRRMKRSSCVFLVIKL